MTTVGASVRRSVVALGAALVMGAVATTTSATATLRVAPAASGAGAAGGAPGPLVARALAAGRSPALRELPEDHGQSGRPKGQRPGPRRGSLVPGRAPGGPLQQAAAPKVATPSVTSFEGTGNVDTVIPPDTDGAVGPNHYVELVNQHYQVFTKTGASVAGPVESAQMWSPFSTLTNAAQLCNTSPGGDGIVLYDRGADRWLFSELAFTNGLFGPTGPFVECFAVSQTPDPAGAYYLYAFLMDQSQLPDYPKIGIWGNSYYLSANLFSSAFATAGNPAVWAFDRTAMLTGGGPQFVEFAGYVPSTYNTILPADVDGAAQPPPGSPEIFAGLDFATNTTLGLWQFSQVDWANPGAATFTGPLNLPVASYSTLCGLSQDCLDQPGTTQKLDAISDRVMYRLAYRNFGDHEALVVNHTVNAASTGNQAGVRWYEVDRALVGGQPSGQFAVAQQGTYAPDTNNRWMASVAMDGAGNMAMGYSIDSATMHPSIAFTGRLKCDPANQLTVAEGTIQSGAGSQTGYNRWGDYTRMAIDPVDDSTFWYVGEYYSADSPNGWRTRIGSFKLPACVQGADTTPPTVALTSPAAGAAVRGTVTLAATATDDQTVASVEFLVDGVHLATVTSPPYQTPWNTTTASAGPHVVEALATDGAGLTKADTRTVTVDNVAPTVSLTSPAPGSTVAGSVTLNANAADSGSGVAKVDFLVDGAVIATTTTAPYTATWNTGTSANSAHALSARATDVAGNATTSATVSVTVNNVGHVMHIKTMSESGQVGLFSWQAWADATVVDQNGNPVSGATVTFTFSGGASATRTCTTGSTGYCSTSGKKVTVPLSQRSETAIASNVAKKGTTWDGVKYGVTLTRP